MILVMYSEEQNEIRTYDCSLACWEDMKDIYVGANFKNRYTSLATLISWGWELVGEL